MVHRLGRTELENLAPPERTFFWQNRIEFWQKEIIVYVKPIGTNITNTNLLYEAGIRNVMHGH